MNDDDVLATVRSSLTGVKESLTDVHLDRSADAIRGRARGRRLRRGLAGAGAGGVALGVGLALAAGGGGSGTPAAPSVHVNLDAWSVDTLPSGLVYLDVRELREPALLRQTLARAGVPAIVTFGEFCSAAGAGDGADLQQVLGKAASGGQPRLTIDPAAIPAGSELSIGIMPATKQGAKGFNAAFGLVRDGAPLTCGNPYNKPGIARPGAGKGKQGPAKAVS